MLVPMVVAAACAGGALVLTACGNQSAYALPPTASAVISFGRSLPAGVAFNPERDDVVWVGQDRLAVVSWGSSTCPSLPTRVQVTSGNAMTVTMGSAADESGVFCTLDLTGTTSLVRLPSALDPRRTIRVTIVDPGYGTTVTLPPHA